MDGTGHEELQLWFGLSYACWLTLPRICMEQMPDKWQGDMAKLLSEFNAEYPNYDLYTVVQLTEGENRKFIQTPEWLTRGAYRHPHGYQADLNKLRDQRLIQERIERDKGE